MSAVSADVASGGFERLMPTYELHLGVPGPARLRERDPHTAPVLAAHPAGDKAVLLPPRDQP